MNVNEIFQFLKKSGCCDACCTRYLSVKNPDAYENIQSFVTKFQYEENHNQEKSKNIGKLSFGDTNNADVVENADIPICKSGQPPPKIDAIKLKEQEEPLSKKRKVSVCVSCIGILQEETWNDCIEKVIEVMIRKRYECNTFACALSAPIATMLREKALVLLLKEHFPGYGSDTTVTPLKEAWKWSFGPRLSSAIAKTLLSGAVSPLLITVNMDYIQDLEELELLKAMTPSVFEERSKQKKRFCTEFTRRAVDVALESLSLEALKNNWDIPAPPAAATCVSVMAAHTPIYFGGRYIKLSRQLPQTPWVVHGVVMMEGSVQEIIFKPIAKLYNIDGPAKGYDENRLNFIASGREDVDVRCLGGRPFVVELLDPQFTPDADQLQQLCREISESGDVIVTEMKLVTKDDLTCVKQGEQVKSKTYEALCIKLSRTPDDPPDEPIRVTEKDIENINTYTNCPDGSCKVILQQKTPVRVLHRRPLLTRERKILELSASMVSGHPQLFLVQLRTEAGTYVKEWVHGDFGRTTPRLADALHAQADILALDVCEVHLQWPPPEANGDNNKDK